jgi:hypothetical protein
MAWTAPRTWVDDEVVTASLLNTHVRDNELALDQHGHDGTSGDGSTTLGDLVKETMTDAAAPAAPGAGLTALYTVSGKPHYRAGAAGGDTELSEVGHGHTFVEDDSGTANVAGANDGTFSGERSDIADSGGVKDASKSITASKSAMIAAGGVGLAVNGIGDADHKQQMIIDGVVVTTINNPQSPIPNEGGHMVIAGSRSVSSGARTSTNRLRNDDLSTWIVGRYQSVNAVAVII